MDRPNADVVHLHATQVGPERTTPVPLRSPQEDARMLPSETVDRIHELVAQGLGAKRIARQLGIARNTVRRYLAGARVGFQERPAARRLDEPTRQEVQRLFATTAQGNAVVIQQELAARGHHVELRTIQRAVVDLRRQARAQALATVRFETKPGQQLQVDFGEKIVTIAGVPVTVLLMTAVLGYSRRLFCRAFLAQRQDDWLEGLEEAFRHFGGLPEQLLCDNASPLVNSHHAQTGEVVWHPGFAACCKDRGITPRACRPRRARTKGKIERGVGYVKHNALAGRSFASFAALQRHLARWMVQVADRRTHGTTGEQPIVRFEREERAALRPLPSRPLAVRTRRLSRRVSADCFVDVDTVRYSVPHRYVRETVEVVVGAQQVEIWLRGTCLARHRRCEEPRAWVRDPAHFEGLYRGPESAAVPPPAVTGAAATMPSPLARPLSVYAELVEGRRP
jgi:transposase